MRIDNITVINQGIKDYVLEVIETSDGRLDAYHTIMTALNSEYLTNYINANINDIAEDILASCL